jgi:hypothetical protein
MIVFRVVKKQRRSNYGSNQIARSVIKDQRGLHPVYVFPFKGERIGNIHNSAWKKAGFPID